MGFAASFPRQVALSVKRHSVVAPTTLSANSDHVPELDKDTGDELNVQATEQRRAQPAARHMKPSVRVSWA
jgi:hypothetical protein